MRSQPSASVPDTTENVRTNVFPPPRSYAAKKLGVLPEPWADAIRYPAPGPVLARVRPSMSGTRCPPADDDSVDHHSIGTGRPVGRLRPVAPDAHVLFGDVEPSELIVGDAAFSFRAHRPQPDSRGVHESVRVAVGKPVLRHRSRTTDDESVGGSALRARVEAQSFATSGHRDAPGGRVRHVSELPRRRIDRVETKASSVDGDDVACLGTGGDTGAHVDVAEEPFLDALKQVTLQVVDVESATLVVANHHRLRWDRWGSARSPGRPRRRRSEAPGRSLRRALRCHPVVGAGYRCRTGRRA